MSNLWTVRSGTKLAVLEEDVFASINLPVDSNASTKIISGDLPDGMMLTENILSGVPTEIPRNTVFRFVIRATLSSIIEDRTFSIEIQGEDEPVWQTPEDLLPVGNNGTFYILDSSPVNYQLEAVDPDTNAGQELKYFIANDGGELPPGLTLTEGGRLIGVVDPILALEKEAAEGNFDQGRFDRYPYDFAISISQGFDSFFFDVSLLDEDQEEKDYYIENNLGYDAKPYDLSTPVKTPRKLNRYYQFTVSVSDGDTVAKRTFRIFVVGDDFLRADNVIMQVGTGIFTADNTYLRTPIWLTPSNLGVRRANNFVTLFLDVLDPNDIAGIVTYDLLSVNDDGSRSELPPGTIFDRNTGEIFGRVPYQPAITREYKFTINARRIESGANTVQLQQFAVDAVAKNSTEIKINKLRSLSSKAIGRTFSISGLSYTVESIDTISAEFDIVTIDQPLFEDLSQGAEIDLGLVTIASQEISESSKTFTVRLIGEIDSTITWLTDSDLGTIPSNYISILKVEAETTVPNSFLLYTLEEGSLPPGLELSFFGEITGKIDNDAVTENTEYQFTVRARDQFGFSAISRRFTITVLNQDDTFYSNIYYKPLLTVGSRNNFRRFLSDPAIFQPDLVYRLDDKNFGIKREPEILVYAGVETLNAEQYVVAASKFAARKKLKIQDVKKAVAKIPGTNQEVYEVVYLDVYDPYEHDGDVAKERSISNGASITVDSMSATPNNPLYDTTLLSNFEIETRLRDSVNIVFANTLSIETRNLDAERILENNTTVETRGGSIEFLFERGSATNIDYRPDRENTIKADTTAVLASDTQINTKFMSNTSNIRDKLREIGKTERDFLPLWMRTAQEGSLQELGFTLAVPLAYCKPGTADAIISAIRVSEFDFRQFNLEVDRFVIDAVEGSSEDSYILFANREFTLG
jgi:hypothetical protein